MSHSLTENVQSFLYNINMSLYISLYSISFRWIPEGPVSQNHTPHLQVARWCPWDLFRSIKICLDAKESGVRKETGSYRTYSVPGKAAVLVSEFEVENLSSTELQPGFRSLQWRTCRWTKHTDDDVFKGYCAIVFSHHLSFCNITSCKEANFLCNLVRSSWWYWYKKFLP